MRVRKLKKQSNNRDWVSSNGRVCNVSIVNCVPQTLETRIILEWYLDDGIYLLYFRHISRSYRNSDRDVDFGDRSTSTLVGGFWAVQLSLG